MHPELFELKALVAGRLDAHRRREIDDHLGRCAECSRQYVAIMLGNTSPKTAEAEAREALIPTSAGSGAMAIAGNGAAARAPAYGIDSSIVTAAPPPAPAPRPAPVRAAEIPQAPLRGQQAVSASLVDAITRLRAESEAAAVAPPPTAPAASPVLIALAPEIVVPAEPESPLIEPSIFMPTPLNTVSILNPAVAPATARPVAPNEASASTPKPELVVTFSSTPVRTRAQRSATQQPASTPSDAAYVSLAVPTSLSQPLSEYIGAPARPADSQRRFRMALVIGAAAFALIVAVSGYRYFQTSVSAAARAAAADAAKQVKATAAAATTALPAAPSAPAVQTRIVYRDAPRRSGEAARDTKPSRADAPVAGSTLTQPSSLGVVLPDVNLPTQGADAALVTNAQRSATSELTRSARATASRTGSPRP